MEKKTMTAEQKLEKVVSILEYYINNGFSGYKSLLAISRGEWGEFNNDWEESAFNTCQELIELLGLAEPQESEEDEDGVEVEVIDDEE